MVMLRVLAPRNPLALHWMIAAILPAAAEIGVVEVEVDVLPLDGVVGEEGLEGMVDSSPGKGMTL